MVTVSHQQSRLAPPCRVIIETNVSSQFDASYSASRSTFICAGLSFAVFDDADDRLVKAAIEFIAKGHTAAVIPHHMIRPEAIFFDMDATVIEEESLVEIAKASGKSHEIEEITIAAMAGGMDFKESLRARLTLLKGVDRSLVLSVKPTITKGMKHLSDWCLQHKIPKFLVSGGFVDLAHPVAMELGFKDFRANRFAWHGDKLAGHAEGDILDGEGKRLAVGEWCKIHQIAPKRCIAVGDGANDLLMMNFCGLAAGFSPKKVLWEHIQVANHTGDHRFLIGALAPVNPPMI